MVHYKVENFVASVPTCCAAVRLTFVWPFELKIGTPATLGLGNVYTNFWFCAF